ncbi:MAG: HEAT repeat domain-containing protein, partial [Armatimonadota bacterium]|nr:HEAT repeat domain-containing protein [Armatimonadota bacterium]
GLCRMGCASAAQRVSAVLRGEGEAGLLPRWAGVRRVLRRALEHPNGAVRERAARALASLGDFGALRRALFGGVGAATAAAGALGERSDRGALLGLVRALDRPQAAVRVAAARALGRIGDPMAAPHLRRCLTGSDAAVCRAAAEALASLEPPSVAALAEALEHTDPEVRRAAERALSCGGVAAVLLLTGYLSHPRRALRLAAARLLGNLGWEAGSALEPLRRAAKEERDREVRRAMGSAAARIEAALSRVPAELQAAQMEGRGTELMAGSL